MSVMKPMIQAKVVIVGEQGVGKTSLVVRFIKNEFDDHCTSTIGASYFTKRMEFDDQKVNLHIWDTAGQERFKAMMPMYYRNSAAALLIFDVTQPQTFLAAKLWAKELHINADRHLVLYLVGSKVDRPTERSVSEEEGREYANALSAHYWEVSSLTNKGIDELFGDLTENVINAHISNNNKSKRIENEIKKRKSEANVTFKPETSSMLTESCC